MLLCSLLKYLSHSYVRLNEFPELYTVNENRLYLVRTAAADRIVRRARLRADSGIQHDPENWIVEHLGARGYGSWRNEPKS